MKYFFLILIFFILKSNCFSQNNENIILKVFYKTIITKNNRLPIEDTCLLSVSDSYSYFRSLGKEAYWEMLRTFVSNSKKNASIDQVNNFKLPPAGKFFPYSCYKVRAENKSYMIQHLGDVNYAFRVDNEFPFNWKILSDSQTINKLHCIKAIGSYDTAKLEVWFCPDIPIADGPSIYLGLPGLIVKSISSSGINCELLSMQYIEKPKELNLLSEKIEFTTYKDFSKALKAYKEQNQSGKPVVDGNATMIFNKKE